MIIEVARIPPDGKRISWEEDSAILMDARTGAFAGTAYTTENTGNEEVAEDFRVDGPIYCKLFAQLVSNELIVRGDLRVDLYFRCSRCAEMFQTSVEEPDFLCARQVMDKNESVDLTEDIREAILLVFPSFPICRPDCLGLCAQCGQNLNEKQCGCAPAGNFAWSALDGLKMSSGKK